MVTTRSFGRQPDKQSAATTTKSSLKEQFLLKKRKYEPKIAEDRHSPPSKRRRNICVKHEPVDDAEAGEEHDEHPHFLKKPKDEAPFHASPYESLRLQRIAENQARMAALGVHKSAAKLTTIFRARKSNSTPRKVSPAWKTIEMSELCARRSARLKSLPAIDYSKNLNEYDDVVTSPTRRNRMMGLKLVRVLPESFKNYNEPGSPRPANAPLPRNCPEDLKVSAQLLQFRCNSKGRGSLYDAIVGICCHFCRQKKLCGEEDCERCGYRDVTKPCLGKTDCSKCHSSTGVFCRACLKIRYGLDIEEVRENEKWLCPHCTEEEGSDPYWICNSSICLTRRNISPTGIAIFKAREQGFPSVAHYLADLLKHRGFIR